MFETITIIGLGQIGTSVGLALAQREEQITRLGYDLSAPATRYAIESGALEQVAMGLAAAVRDADVIFLALPYDQVLDTMQRVVADLKPDALILDCAPVRSVLTEQLKEILPGGCTYLGFTPLIGPKKLADANNGFMAADAQLLQGSKVAISAPADTPEKALNQATDLSKMLGATPLFADVGEVDGLMAAVHLLPQLGAAALTQAVMQRAGSQERGRFAGRAFSLGSAPAITQDTAAALSEAALDDQENVLRVLDDLLAALETQRQLIAEGEQSRLQTSLEDSQNTRREWWVQRNKGYPPATEKNQLDLSQVQPNWFGQFFGIRRRRRK